MLYEKLTLATILIYLITAAFFFSNAFIKDWFSVKATKANITYQYHIGLHQVCEITNNTCSDFDDLKGGFNPVHTDLETIYYSLLIGGSLTGLAFLVMLIQTEDKKRTNHFTVFHALRHFTSLIVAFSLGGACWMEYRLFKVKLSQGYDATNGFTYDSKRTTGYILSWLTTVFCFIAVCLGIAERWVWKSHFRTPSYVIHEIESENVRLNTKEETKYT